MRFEKKTLKRVRKPAFLLLVMAVLALAMTSCGSKSESSTATSTTKLPPGTTSESVSQTSSTTAGTASTTTTGSTSTSTSTSKTTTSSKQVGVTLELVNFTVTGVARDDSNSAVVSGNSRELTGDFLQIDMTITNASGELLDLSDFSYRLYSTAIAASSYEDYYGTSTTYGGYVKKNTISASLLDTSTLQQVSYTLRDGESVDEAFLFYDLNPLTTDANASFTLDGATLIIYDTSTEESVEIDLGAFAG